MYKQRVIGRERKRRKKKFKRKNQPIKMLLKKTDWNGKYAHQIFVPIAATADATDKLTHTQILNLFIILMLFCYFQLPNTLFFSSLNISHANEISVHRAHNQSIWAILYDSININNNNQYQYHLRLRKQTKSRQIVWSNKQKKRYIHPKPSVLWNQIYLIDRLTTNTAKWRCRWWWWW